MRLLSVDDPLPYLPERILVAGSAGSGKTTLCQRIAELLAIEHVEIDALFHGPAWTPRESFVADVDAFTSTRQWVTEWQYTLVRDVLASRADLLIWLDLPRATVMRQMVARTIRRRLRREVLWNGNAEPPLWTFVTNRDHIVRWAWTTYHKTAVRIAQLEDQQPKLPIVRLDSHAMTTQWIHGPLTLARSRRPKL